MRKVFLPLNTILSSVDVKKIINWLMGWFVIVIAITSAVLDDYMWNPSTCDCQCNKESKLTNI